LTYVDLLLPLFALGSHDLPGIFGYYIAVVVEESPEFEEMQSSGAMSKQPLKEIWAKHWRTVINVFIVCSVWCVGVYTGFTWLVSGHFTLHAALAFAYMTSCFMHRPLT
jgi:hypothetical protein